MPCASGLDRRWGPQSPIPEGAARELLLEARAAVRKVNRVGFRGEDRAGTGMLVALKAGAPAVVEVLDELDRLPAALSRMTSPGNIGDDRAHFLAAFQRIYLSQAGC
jgi:hypothetical protein